MYLKNDRTANSFGNGGVQIKRTLQIVSHTHSRALHSVRLTLPAMEGRSPRPVVPGRRQAVKQGRRAKRQRACCKLHPSAVEPFVGVLRSQRRACDGVAKRHGRRAAGAQ